MAEGRLTLESCSMNIWKNFTNNSDGTSGLVSEPISVRHCKKRKKEEKKIEKERKRERERY